MRRGTSPTVAEGDDKARTTYCNGNATRHPRMRHTLPLFHAGQGTSMENIDTKQNLRGREALGRIMRA